MARLLREDHLRFYKEYRKRQDKIKYYNNVNWRGESG